MDFGLMKVFGGPQASALATKCGTTNYMAPEIDGASYAGEPVDVFALGVLLFMILTA